MKTGDRVRIVGNHPHKGETGTVNSTHPPHLSSVLPGLRDMIRIDLDDSEDGCYAKPIELRRLQQDEDARR
jgi:hypothetical protein